MGRQDTKYHLLEGKEEGWKERKKETNQPTNLQEQNIGHTSW